ncbi:MAG: RES domain-containing protein [Alphaproteobacteria bacterium]|nr:RES domain-containing protein [Alphaproteobacteria bacterium]
MAITLWRISNHADLSGRGGMLYPARWHSAGRPVVYLAESSSGALLEMLVHMRVFNTPSDILLHRVEISGDSDSENVEEKTLTAGWRADKNITRAIGDTWLAARTSLLLRVPSVIVPYAWNYLLNPLHPGASQAGIIESISMALDERLKE